MNYINAFQMLAKIQSKFNLKINRVYHDDYHQGHGFKGRLSITLPSKLHPITPLPSLTLTSCAFCHVLRLNSAGPMCAFMSGLKPHMVANAEERRTSTFALLVFMIVAKRKAKDNMRRVIRNESHPHETET
jgi:hypothetical protein